MRHRIFDNVTSIMIVVAVVFTVVVLIVPLIDSIMGSHEVTPRMEAPR